MNEHSYHEQALKRSVKVFVSTSQIGSWAIPCSYWTLFCSCFLFTGLGRTGSNSSEQGGYVVGAKHEASG